jgi:hypothetical protein
VRRQACVDHGIGGALVGPSGASEVTAAAIDQEARARIEAFIAGGVHRGSKIAARLAEAR